ncbi:MAG: FHA domain-containing protein [Candidatus Sumerlaeia bacterium]|nr:FHA domain-containing protein [Candidatus Sumerlaeia bacterium]
MAEIRLKIYRSPKDYRTETFRQPRITIGRDINNDIVIAEKAVSRSHCRIECLADGWQLTDLESTNGTYLNGIAIRQSRLKDGDVIVVGSVRLHVLECLTADTAEEPLTLGGFRLVQAFDARGMVGARRGQTANGADTATQTEHRSDTRQSPVPYYPTVLAPVLTAAEILQGASSPCTLARTVGLRLFQVVEADACHVFLREAETGALQPVAAEPPHAEPALVPGEVLDYVRQSNRSVYVEGGPAAGGAKPAGAVCAVMCAPILDGDQLFGAIALVRQRTPWNFGDPDFETLSVAAISAGAAMSCAQSYGRLEQAYRDLLKTVGETPASE